MVRQNNEGKQKEFCRKAGKNEGDSPKIMGCLPALYYAFTAAAAKASYIATFIVLHPACRRIKLSRENGSSNFH